METYTHFETKHLSYTDLKRVTATSVFVTKMLNKNSSESDKDGNK